MYSEQFVFEKNFSWSAPKEASPSSPKSKRKNVGYVSSMTEA
jgi:hypothetical protein